MVAFWGWGTIYITEILRDNRSKWARKRFSCHFKGAVNLNASASVSILVVIVRRLLKIQISWYHISSIPPMMCWCRDCPSFIPVWHFITLSHIIPQVCNLTRFIYGLWRDVLLLVLTELINASVNLSAQHSATWRTFWGNCPFEVTGCLTFCYNNYLCVLKQCFSTVVGC